MNLTTITNYINYKGGVNNLKVVSVISGYLTIAVFTGRRADKRAQDCIAKYTSGETV